MHYQQEQNTKAGKEIIDSLEKMEFRAKVFAGCVLLGSLVCLKPVARLRSLVKIQKKFNVKKEDIKSLEKEDLEMLHKGHKAYLEQVKKYNELADRKKKTCLRSKESSEQITWLPKK